MTEPVSKVKLNEIGVRPIIVQFQNGKLQAGEEKNLQTTILQDGYKTIAAVASKEIVYTGSVNREEDLYNNFLLVKSKKTGKVRMIAVDTAILTPRVNLKRQKAVENNELSSASKSVRELHKQFGSKKIQRVTEQKERLKMDVEVIKEQLEQTVAGIEIDESDNFKPQGEENDSVYRPPIHRDASTKEQVYVLHELIPENILNSLEVEANNALETDLDSLNLSPFVRQCLTPLQESSSSNSLDKCKILLYINYLIKFIQTSAKSINRKFVICQTSKDVNNHILDNFSVLTDTGRTRSLSMRDKTVCFILVLSMICLDFIVDIETLAKDLKIGVKKLTEMGRILAFSSGKNKNEMVLKLPLPPAVSLVSRKRKR